MSVAPLKLSWATSTHVRGTSSALGEPDWLLADRLAALEALDALPAEPNQLFITYLDLRAVDFSAVEPYPPTPAAADLAAAGLPEGAAALIHVDERAMVSCLVSDAARQAGLVISTLAEAARQRSDLLRPFLEGGASLPERRRLRPGRPGTLVAGHLHPRPGRREHRAAHRAALEQRCARLRPRQPDRGDAGS